MKHINSMGTLNQVEKTVDKAYEMARQGMVDSAIDTVKNAHDSYKNNISTGREIPQFIVLAGCHKYTVC